MQVVWQIENDPFCRKILARHWPEVERYGDITTLEPSILAPVDLLCGGFPCQDLSVAGARKGLAGERSSLFWDFIRIADVLRPRWLLIENVLGLFSSQSGRDFLRVVSALDERGYGVAWRVLDSQNFGVAQRRRRVFIVGHLGGPCPPEVLFEPESLSRDTQAGREAGEGVAGAVTSSAGHHGHSSPRGDGSDNLVSYALTGRSPGERLEAEGNYVIHNGQGDPNWDVGRAFALDTEQPSAIVVNARQDPVLGVSLDTDGHSHAVAVRLAQTSSNGWGVSEDGTYVSASADPNGVREVAGLPKGLDSPRYRALGNAVTVPVIEWIGRRLML
jgi:DNA (cytosine-5)-methyltransferase 1